MSQRLADELAMQRRDILAAHLEHDPGLALDLAIFLMADGRFGHRFETRGSTLSAAAAPDPVFGFKTPDAPAAQARAETEQALDRSWNETGDLVARFDAFRALSEDSRGAWLGHCVARTLEASLALGGEAACPLHDHLGRLLGIEVPRWWRPTGINYFDRVRKDVALGALRAVGGDPLAQRYAKAKKTELAEACQRIFAGDFIAEAAVKQAALDWVPEVMRFAGPAIAEADEPDVSSALTAKPERSGDEPSEPTSVEDASVNDVAADDVAADDVAADDVPAEAAPADDGPVDNAPIEAAA